MEENNQSEVITLLKDLKRQMTALERKVDLMSNSSSRSSKFQKYSSSSTGGATRYKSKHESPYGAKQSAQSKWYDKINAEKERSETKKRAKNSKRPSKKSLKR